MNLSFGAKWENCKLYTNNIGGGTTTCTVNDDVLTCQSIIGSSAKAVKYIQVMPGDVVQYSCMARVVAGESAGIAIDWPTSGDTVTIQKITSREWMFYKVTACIPKNSAVNGYVTVQSGVFGSNGGTAEFTNPVVDKMRSSFGGTQTIAMGLIYFDSSDNNIKIHTGFSNHGVYSVAYSSAAKEATLNIGKTQRLDPENIGGDPFLPLRPLFFGDPTADNAGSGLNVKFYDYNYLTGDVKARFYNSSGTLVDVLTLLGSGSIYFNFKAEV